MAEFWTQFGYTALTGFIALCYAMFLYATIARTIAKVQGRIGMPYWQAYIDLFKNMGKRTAISHGIMFDLGPVFRVAGALGVFIFIPVVYNNEIFANFSFQGDLLLVMYFVFFGSLGMALGAGEGGHPYSPIGVSRGLAQMSAYEVPFALSIVSILIQYQTLSITNIIAAQQGGFMTWTVMTNPLATITAMLALLGMNMYPPFNIVGAPNEIPIGPATEYQSAYLGLMSIGRLVFAAAKLVLFMNLFFGGATGFSVFGFSNL
ncbi:NADH-quinone oxidoreductase subunit H, partial [bacterium]|nr:NADH-quinone oxidoreductase subunit H [bacterium]